MSRSTLIQDIADNITTNGNGEVTASVMRSVLENIVSETAVIKRMWVAEFNQGTGFVGATPQITERVNVGFTFNGVTRNNIGGGVVQNFGFDFSGTNFNIQKTIVLSGNGIIGNTTGTPAYNRFMTSTFLANNFMTLYGHPINDLGGDTKDINNSSPFKIVIVEFE